MHQEQIDILHPQVLQALLQPLPHPLVPGVVQLGRQPDLFPGDARRLDPLPDFLLVAIPKGRVNVAVSIPKSRLNRLSDLTGGGLPGSEADGWDGETWDVEGVPFAKSER